MNTVIDLLGQLVELILSFFDVVFSFLSDIEYAMKMCVSVVAQIPSAFVWLPEHMLSLVCVAFGVVVVYKVLGREG